MQVAVVEDDQVIAKAISTAVGDAGHRCRLISDGDVAMRDDSLLDSDLIILDLMLPGADGLTLLRLGTDAGRADPGDRAHGPGTRARQARGLRGRADDYLVKPFAMDELLARIEAVHRRSVDKPTMTLTVGGLHVSLANRRATLDGRPIELTPTEFNILELLMRFHGQVVTRKMLCEHVWGFDWEGPTNVIEVHINRLRGKVDKGATRR